LPCSAPYRDYSDDYRGHDFLAGLELARPVEIGNGWEIRPVVNQDYIRQTVGSYTEKGEGDRALKSERQRNELWITRMGTGIVWQGEEAGRGWRFTGGGQAYWQGRSGDLSADARIAFRDDASGASYQSKSERLPRHSLGLGFHATWNQRDRMNIRLGYDLRVSKRETAHEGSIKMEWNW
jgi:outer membrane autotransporter protein